MYHGSLGRENEGSSGKNVWGKWENRAFEGEGLRT